MCLPWMKENSLKTVLKLSVLFQFHFNCADSLTEPRTLELQRQNTNPERLMVGLLCRPNYSLCGYIFWITVVLFFCYVLGWISWSNKTLVSHIKMLTNVSILYRLIISVVWQQSSCVMCQAPYEIRLIIFIVCLRALTLATSTDSWCLCKWITKMSGIKPTECWSEDGFNRRQKMGAPAYRPLHGSL